MLCASTARSCRGPQAPPLGRDLSLHGRGLRGRWIGCGLSTNSLILPAFVTIFLFNGPLNDYGYFHVRFV